MSFNLAAAVTAGTGTGANGTQAMPSSFIRLPTNLLEAFIPGYSLISGFILEWLGFDISLFVSIFALVFGFGLATKYSYEALRSLARNYLTASVTVYAHDDIYDHILGWISEQTVTMKSRELMVKSGWVFLWDDEDGDSDPTFAANCQPGALVNFRNWEDKLPPRFEPYESSNWFRHKGHWFCLEKEKETVLGSGFGQGLVNETERLTILALGRSTQPIKNLILEARDLYLSKGKGRTVVRRPSPKETRHRGDYLWTKVAARPSRPIETVVLDQAQKDSVLLDINEYLHPSTPHWYANRGIPYRRGYLFHGPPGTGKTSLSFAIAGVFGLDIYCVSLLEPTLTEEDLGVLFNNLPRRCVVLLEDIDTAGLGRTGGEEGSDQGSGDDTDAGDTFPGVSKKNTRKKRLIRKKKNPRSDSDTDEPTGISLSGLLNAIDGVASHEGRVLVMTTNHPEKLDPALIRPGRVDMEVEFTLATRAQIQEIFIRMYSPDTPILANTAIRPPVPNRAQAVRDTVLGSRVTLPGASHYSALKDNSQLSPPPSPQPSESSTSSSSACGDSCACRCPTPSDSPHAASASAHGLIDEKDADLSILAAAFAESLPESVFSPAEIQGFLLTRKGDPLRAVREVAAWREQQMVAKRRTKQKRSNLGSGHAMSD